MCIALADCCKFGETTLDWVRTERFLTGCITNIDLKVDSVVWNYLHANWMELVLWRVIGITVYILQSCDYRTLFY
jgi:hypothetical protein